MNSNYFVKNYIFPLLLLLNSQIISQNSEPLDSLLVKSYDELSEKYYEYKFTDSIQAKKYVDAYLKKARREKNTVEIIEGKLFLSEVLHNESYYLNYLDSLISIYKRNPNKNYPAFFHLEKGTFFLNKSKDKKSLDEYLEVLKYTRKIKNDSLKYNTKQRIAILKAKNKNYDDAGKLYNEVYNYYKVNPPKKESSSYFALLLNICINYIDKSIFDSASYYNQKAYQYALKINNKKFIYYSKHRQGQIEFSKKNYLPAIDSLKKVIPVLVEDEDYSSIYTSYKYIAQSYYKLGNKNETLRYNLLIDSLYNKTNIVHFSQRDGYSFLIDHYKEKNDLKNQLKYIEKLLKVDSILNSRSKNVTKTFTEKYDTPKLIAEKERLISTLESNLSSSKKWVWSFILFSIGILLYLTMEIKKRKTYKKRFQNLLNEQTKNRYQMKQKKSAAVKENITIPKEVISEILNHLEEFEKNHQYISPEITLSVLAKQFYTNSNYLSKVINHYKGQSFTNYLNSLRIDHIVEKLKDNPTFRKYSIKGLASEAGFNNPESFSKAFYKSTGIKPSYFIKELGKKDTN